MSAGPLETFEAPTPVWGMNIASRIIRRAEETCTSDNANMCEKPVGSRTPTIAIILGIVIPVVGITFVLLYLHRKNVAKFKKEDQDDPHKELDFGLGDKNPGVKAGLRRSIFGVGEKATHKHQLSMDMDMSTPYLLPPQLQTSRESLHSLARSMKNTEDPYRPVQYAGSDVGSLRSVQRGPGGEMASLYSASIRSGGTRDFGPNRQNSLPRPAPAADPFQRKPMPSADGSMSPTSIMSSDAFRPGHGSALGRKPSAPYPDEKFAMNESDVVEMPDSQPRALGSPPNPPKLDVALPAPDTQTSLPGQFASPMSATIETAEPAAPANYHGGFDFGDANASRGMSAGDEFIGTAHSSPPPQQANLYEGAQQPQESFVADGSHGYDNYNSPQDYQQEGPMDYEFEPRAAAPTIMETEDPEHRANRIRSFYKEYFDDQAPASHPPVPEIPPQAAERRAVPPGPQPQRAQTNEYYEDYDGAYLENTFFDPGSNTFVMPYAQPVHRRAMTPPPRAPDTEALLRQGVYMAPSAV
ncbi:unnamed protein product [Parascedosporium putredinis]|uniref:Uncharacterized protein n=1 Tax=Parascedosporium putredinis TaxID=1442378 RepID=A0A9P1H9S6_9PEZI|nr:unnamed protein product [Parascedosporium putredinis]CAI8001145.1 unnamed protein product [Parascedosporium putredinis]